MTIAPIKAFLALSLACVLVLATASASSAYPPVSGDTGGTTGGGNNSGGGNGGGNSGGGGTGGGGGGGTSGTWSNTLIKKGNPTSATLRAPAPRAKKSGGSFTARCSGGNQWGAYVGMKAYHYGHTTTYDGSANDSGGYHYYYQDGGSRECLSPPKWNDRNVQCGWTIGATGTGPAGNPRVSSTTKKFPVTSTAFKKGGGKSLAECPKAMVQQFDWPSTEFGKYRLSADGQAVTCTIRDYYQADYFGRLPKDYIKSCGSPHAYSHNQVKWTLWCGGFSLGWKNRSFTEEECGDTTSVGTPFRWTCGISKTNYPYLGGARNNKAISVYHDGKKQPMSWTPQPKIGGKVKNLSEKKAKIIYKSGTPFRKGSNPSDADQHFSTDPKIDSYQSGWEINGSAGKTTFDGQFFKAGMPGQNLKLAPFYYFRADFAVRTVTITSVNWGTGKVTTKTGTAYQNKVATCEGVPTNLKVVRSRISN